MFLPKLAFSNFAARRVRSALTIAAIALSVSLVVAVTSGYKSAEAAAYKFLEQYMGSTDVQITREADLHAGVPESLVEEFRRDPEVRAVTARLEMESTLLDRQGKPILGRAAQIIGIHRPEDKNVETLRLEQGEWFNASEGNVAVVDQIAAEKLGVKLGETFLLPGLEKQLELEVVGIVHKPQLLASQVQTVYLPLQTLRDFAIPDQPRQVSRIMIDLETDADAAGFADRWEPRLGRADAKLKLRLARDNRKEMDKNLRGVNLLSYLGGTVSMLAATFIVFSALSMGVAERQRILAMMRAVGAFRWQIGTLVIGEGLLLATAGALIGVPLGVIWVYLLAWRFADFFTAGVIVSWGGILFGSIGSLLAALTASFLPAWLAMRVSPLEAMSPLSAPQSPRLPLWSAMFGLALISIDPLLLFGPLEGSLRLLGFEAPQQLSREIQFYGHFALGLPGVMIGFFLLAPALIWLIERLIGPIVAAMFGLRFSLLRQQLTTGVWRAAGTCAALMVGLATLVTMQTQGHTTLSSWKIPDQFPDIFIVSFKLGGLNEQEQQKLATVKGIKPGEVMPIAIATPQFGGSIFGLASAAIMPEATMFFGVDPDKALKMMQLDFRTETGESADPQEQKRLAEQATEMLKKGRHIIVTDEFRQLKGLHVGDKLPLKTSRHGTVDYTIAGVVWSPGLDIIVSKFDMGRQFDQRTAASVFGSLEDAKNDFGVEGVYLFAANLEYAVDKQVVLDQIQAQLGGWGLAAGDVREIKANIQQGFEQLLLLVSTVAFAAMAVASLGVVNTIMAGIRSRHWQFGILRGIGVTRSQLLRLVLAEAILLGIIGCALGLSAGLEMSLNAQELSATIVGHNPPLAIPWPIILIGMGIVMAVSLLASLWPALNVARTEPLDLLQAGRASA